MYAVIRLNRYDPARLARSPDRLAEFRIFHAAQPGYAGSSEVELGPGEFLTITFWDSEELAAAGRSVVGPQVQRLLVPLMRGPSELVGMGDVIASDLVVTS